LQAFSTNSGLFLSGEMFCQSLTLPLIDPIYPTGVEGRFFLDSVGLSALGDPYLPLNCGSLSVKLSSCALLSRKGCDMIASNSTGSPEIVLCKQRCPATFRCDLVNGISDDNFKSLFKTQIEEPAT